MKGISKKEIGLISDLEFQEKYYFTREDIQKHFKNKIQMRDTIYNLHKKGRIIRLNRNKYYLIPIKAKGGGWSDNPYIAIDEVMDGKDYFVGGWAAANYWRLTDQIPFQLDVYTTKRQGKIKLFHARIVFHRTTKKRINEAIAQELSGHPFRILRKEATAIWVQGRD